MDGLMSYGTSLTQNYYLAGNMLAQFSMAPIPEHAGASASSRTDHQPQDREEHEQRHSGHAARPRQRGDRMSGVILLFLLKPENGRRRLIIVRGVLVQENPHLPFARSSDGGGHSFASATFRSDKLGAAARTASGDLSKQAIAHAYTAMGAAVADFLAKSKLVVAVGS